jgi:predicted RNase H-like HicB family nuclease
VTHYIAIIEDAGPDHAVGVWFPDLPGCTSAGDDIDEALRNAPEALELYADGMKEDGKTLPRPRTLTELKSDPEVAADLKAYMIKLRARHTRQNESLGRLRNRLAMPI